MLTRKITHLFLLIILIISPIYSQTQSEPENTSEAPVSEETIIIPDEGEELLPLEIRDPERNLNTFTFWDFLRMILILAFVIACIYGMFFVLRKLGTKKYSENDIINIISVKALSNNKSLQIVEVGNQVLLIGVSDNGINKITEITDKETIDRIRLEKSEIKKPAENSFQQYMLNTIFRKKENQVSSGENQEEETSKFFKKQRERIEKL